MSMILKGVKEDVSVRMLIRGCQCEHDNEKVSMRMSVGGW